MGVDSRLRWMYLHSDEMLTCIESESDPNLRSATRRCPVLLGVEVVPVECSVRVWKAAYRRRSWRFAQ
jgi:hypothetical protein